MAKLPVNELFETIQGEGSFTGVPSIFIRLQGCPVGCAWCDTKQTWDVEQNDQREFGEIIVKTGDSPTWTSVSVAELVDYCQSNFSAKHVVITGGEPCQYDLTELTLSLEAKGYQCQIETSGTFEVVTSENTWVTVSPKVAMKGRLDINPAAMERADEIKHPVGRQSDIDALNQLLSESVIKPEVVIALQPISQHPRATQLCIDTCIQNNWRLSVQTHKYLEIA